jgi:DNA-directed RNA polymerase subunit RPC12/RpoP
MEKVNILKQDELVQQEMNSERLKLGEYEKLRKDYVELLKNSNFTEGFLKKIQKELEDVENKIKNLQTQTEYNFYTLDTSELILQYQQILSTPIRINFMNDEDTDKKLEQNKKKLVKKYLERIDRYCEMSDDDVVECENCGEKEFVDAADYDVYTCVNCGYQLMFLENGSSYTDSERVNLSSKYSYDKKLHFIECINQYQGKQSCVVEDEVYADLEKELNKYQLIDHTKTEKCEKYANVERSHIILFLKDLRYTKQYENVNLIYHRITGKPLDDISHLTEKLVRDFEMFLNVYDKKYKNKVEKKNFNYQYLLLLLLKKYNHPCDVKDFNVLKTTGRKNYHDQICRQIFMDLGWNHEPLY